MWFVCEKVKVNCRIENEKVFLSICKKIKNLTKELE